MNKNVIELSQKLELHVYTYIYMCIYIYIHINQNSSHEKIKTRLKSGNTSYHSVKNLLINFLSRNIKIKICRNIILDVLS